MSYFIGESVPSNFRTISDALEVKSKGFASAHRARESDYALGLVRQVAVVVGVFT